MDSWTIQDRISRGMGSAARILGEAYDVYRPHGSTAPLAPGNRIMQLPATFDGGYPGYRRPRGYERALRATFDGINVAVGDYLQGRRGVLFVAAMPTLLRPLCVLTTAVLDVLRPRGAGEVGLNQYGGVSEDVLTPVLAGWPGELVVDGPTQGGVLPADGGRARYSVLLPRTPSAIQGADLLQDNSGRRYLILAAEMSELGWRLSVRAAGI